MHVSAKLHCQYFFDVYINSTESTGHKKKIVEIGSQDVNGELEFSCKHDFDYLGVDFVNGKGVDLVLDDPYVIPLESNSVDIVLSSSCFEHSEMFWILFLEILRIMKPSGLFYLNAPSNGDIHRFPVDCWRFYPDSGQALIKWAKRNGLNPTLLESYTGVQFKDIWNDYVAVFVKDNSNSNLYPHRIIENMNEFTNGTKLGGAAFIQPNSSTEDRFKYTQYYLALQNSKK